MVPVSHAEPMVFGSSGATLLRGTLYGVLALMLAAGAWLRFNGQIAAVAPALAGPGGLTNQFAGDLGTRALVELPLLPAADALAAVPGMGLPATDAALLTASLRQGRVRLVRMPLLDAGAPAANGAAHSVQVSAGGYSTLVQLTRQPVAIPLPVGPVGVVSFHGLSAGGNAEGVSIGTIGLSGPVRLPAILPGQELDVGVIAQ